jgi:hypothetical protein
MTAFSDMFATNWACMQTMHGVTATLVDDDGTTSTVTGVLNPRKDETALDATWQERATQSEFHCILPVGYDKRPGECTASISGVVYTVLDYVDSTAGLTKLMLERTTLDSVDLRGRR